MPDYGSGGDVAFISNRSGETSGDLHRMNDTGGQRDPPDKHAEPCRGSSSWNTFPPPNAVRVANSGTLTVSEDIRGYGTLVATDGDSSSLTYSLVDISAPTVR